MYDKNLSKEAHTKIAYKRVFYIRLHCVGKSTVGLFGTQTYDIVGAYL